MVSEWPRQYIDDRGSLLGLLRMAFSSPELTGQYDCYIKSSKCEFPVVSKTETWR